VVTAIDTGFMWDNYYHWLVDALPRVFWLWDPHVKAAAGSHVVLYTRRFDAGPLRQLLEAILPDYVEVRRCDAQTTITGPAYLHLPQLSRDLCGWLPPAYLRRFRDAVDGLWPGAGAVGTRGVYIMRALASKRRVLNERELCETLRPLGIEAIAAEELSIPLQVRFFSHSTLVLAPHGAGLTNILFSRKCRVVELFPGPALGHYRELSRALGHDYVAARFGCAGKNADFAVDTKRVVELLERIA